MRLISITLRCPKMIRRYGTNLLRSASLDNSSTSKSKFGRLITEIRVTCGPADELQVADLMIP
jgi:hypothetical protein